LVPRRWWLEISIFFSLSAVAAENWLGLGDAARKTFKIFQSSAAAAQPLDLHLYLYAFTTFLPFFFFYLLSKQETRNRIAWPLFSSCVKKKKRKKKK
jgi:hypothetical protein